MMGQYDVNQLPVVRGRELIGMLGRADVMRFIQLRQDLGDVPNGDGRAPQPAGSPGAPASSER
jgi:CBS domain-containing protein